MCIVQAHIFVQFCHLHSITFLNNGGWVLCSYFQLAREAMDIAAKAIKVGVTCDEIDRIIHEVHLYVITSVVNKLLLLMASVPNSQVV